MPSEQDQARNVQRDRFHLVVLNADRLELFTRNFSRIRGFDIARDRLVVLDCSRRPASQRRLLDEFARHNGWAVGARVRFVRRRNWGIDQGARIDLLAALHGDPLDRPEFVWQFQEHFLDLDTPAARWPIGTCDPQGRPIAGQLKADTIADGSVIDLDQCEALFDRDADVGVVHAARGGISAIQLQGQGSWLFADGGNFGARTDTLLAAVAPRRLAACRAAYDGTYDWALFMELEWGRLLTACGCTWYDLAARTGASGADAPTLASSEPMQHLALELGGGHGLYARRVEALLEGSPLSLSVASMIGQSSGLTRGAWRRVRVAAATLVAGSRLGRAAGRKDG